MAFLKRKRDEIEKAAFRLQDLAEMIGKDRQHFCEEGSNATLKLTQALYECSAIVLLSIMEIAEEIVDGTDRIADSVDVK